MSDVDLLNMDYFLHEDDYLEDDFKEGGFLSSNLRPSAVYLLCLFFDRHFYFGF
jgi:hypothetical protein